MTFRKGLVVAHILILVGGDVPFKMRMHPSDRAISIIF